MGSTNTRLFLRPDPIKVLARLRYNRHDGATAPLRALWIVVCVSCFHAPSAADLNTLNYRDRLLIAAVRDSALRFTGSEEDYQQLLLPIGQARFVLIGDSTHGTREFYRVRAEITKRLLRQKGFTLVALEAHWPGGRDIDQYIRSKTNAPAIEALEGFKQYPKWLWRNRETIEFIRWARYANRQKRAASKRVRIIGLDLYSLPQSIRAVNQGLANLDQQEAQRAKQAFQCFDRFEQNLDRYGESVALDPIVSCEQSVTEQYRRIDAIADPPGYQQNRERWLDIKLNALTIKNAETYYRLVYSGQNSASWNHRDQHMLTVLETVLHDSQRQGRQEKVVIWAHNSHLGNARATSMAAAGEVNLAQLIATRFPGQSYRIGFLGYRGEVAASSAWGMPVKCLAIKPALENSYAGVLHRTGIESLALTWNRNQTLNWLLDLPRLQRVIGVVYDAENEIEQHYINARLASQFDAVLFYNTIHPIASIDGDCHP